MDTFGGREKHLNKQILCDKKVETGTLLDYAYIAPSALLLLSFLCGIIPSLFCTLNKLTFVCASLILFIISMGFHFYTLVLWRKYWQLGAFPYAIGLPIVHITVLTFATVVSATNTCEKISASKKPDIIEWNNITNSSTEFNFLPATLDKIEKKIESINNHK